MALILVAEDNPINLKLAVLLLKKAGHTVMVAADGQEAIDAVLASPPDLILMDVQMGGMDGLTAVRILKQDAATAAIPIIALTALAMSGDEQKILAAGCEGYIAKPFHYLDFLARIDRMLTGISNMRTDAARGAGPH
jgi:two-component system cell cycle response regulator DivK